MLTGSPYPELNGTYKIFSTSGLTAEINFGSTTRNLLSGNQRNMFHASIYHTKDSSKTKLYELSGSWSDSWKVKDGKGKELYTYDLADAKNQPSPMILATPEKQSPWESRGAWRDVAEPLKTGDYQKALSAKSKLENAQREMRKREKAEGKRWETGFFYKVDVEANTSNGSGKLAQLMEAVGNDEQIRRMLGTDGCWRFDQEKARNWREGQRSRPETPFG